MHKLMRKTGGEETNAQVEVPNPESQQTAKEIGRKLDALLDEIDDVLEQNAEEFVGAMSSTEASKRCAPRRALP